MATRLPSITASMLWPSMTRTKPVRVIGATGDRSALAGLPEGEIEALATQARKRSSEDLQRAFRLLLDADEAIAVPARTIDPQLVLEMAVLRLATLGPLVPLDDLTRRLEALNCRHAAAGAWRRGARTSR